MSRKPQSNPGAHNVYVHLLTMVNWLYLTVKCPPLWRNPVQCGMARMAAKSGNVVWKPMTAKLLDTGQSRPKI